MKLGLLSQIHPERAEPSLTWCRELKNLMQRILTSQSFLIPTFIIASVYVVFTNYLMNAGLIGVTLFGSFSLIYKFNLLFALFQGMWSVMSGNALVLLFLTAFLTGANLTLLIRQLKLLRAASGLHFVVGGNTILGLAGAGCAACGLPVLSILGFSGSILYLPFRGQEISYLSFLLLSISFYLLLKSVYEKEYCVIPKH